MYYMQNDHTNRYVLTISELSKLMKYVGTVLPGMIPTVPLHGCLAERSYKIKDKMPPFTTSPILREKRASTMYMQGSMICYPSFSRCCLKKSTAQNILGTASRVP